MAFWGVEVKPAKPYIHTHDPSRGRLRITQATVGNGNSTKRTLLQCNIDKRSPILLCSLIPDKIESCSLDLEFEEEDDVVFSVIGQGSIHLTGYYSGYGNSGDGDDTDSYGEDIAESETDESGSYDSEDDYEDDFIDDGDIEMFDSSPRPNAGVIIEEIVDDEKPVNGADSSRSLKNNSMEGSDGSPDSDHQIVVKKNRTLVLESEDEDGFPISSSLKRKSSAGSDDVKDVDSENLALEKFNVDKSTASENTVHNLEQQIEKRDQGSPEKHEGEKTKRKEKLKKKKKDRIKKGDVESAENILTGKSKGDASRDQNECDGKESNAFDTHQEQDHPAEKEDETLSNIDEAAVATKSSRNMDKKKKKRRTEEIACETIRAEENGGNTAQNADVSGIKKKKKSKKVAAVGKESIHLEPMQQNIPDMEMKEQEDILPQQTRTFPNGLIVEELKMGKPDGKKATSGKKVSVSYVGKLKNGKIFDSNIGQQPFTFRLGVGAVIKGWDVGVSGMRIGDKRRLTIPPSMGYGSKGVGKIPPNSCLIFDVELVDAK